eukprot:snap_masked-scaffold_4-processed-gene-1.26-mRNA-1 protein AED:1.00 eAED:1.00 QI:0/-1/0/0/-1/1/1/0/143
MKAETGSNTEKQNEEEKGSDVMAITKEVNLSKWRGVCINFLGVQLLALLNFGANFNAIVHRFIHRHLCEYNLDIKVLNTVKAANWSDMGGSHTVAIPVFIGEVVTTLVFRIINDLEVAVVLGLSAIHETIIDLWPISEPFPDT